MTNCQGCGETKLRRIFDLGSMPICNRFLTKEEFKDERYYPLKLVFCESCSLVQLEQVPPNAVVFGSKFGLFSGQSKETTDYLRFLAGNLIMELGLEAGDFVLDVGSNDGTFLRYFKEAGMEVLGVDPAKEVSRTANRSGIPTINGTLENSLLEIKQTVGAKLKLITAMRVIGLTDNIHAFLEGISQLSATFVSQSLYLPDMIENYHWDIIYHEHARYHTVTSLARLMDRHGLHTFDARHETYNGGTFLSFASSSRWIPALALDRIMTTEKRYDPWEAYQDFAFYSTTSADKLINIIKGDAVTYSKVLKKGSRVAGIGAPMKSSTMLNFCNLGADKIAYLTDMSPLKIGTYSPGMHIPVVAEESFFEDPPDAALILAWQAKDRIMKTYRDKGFKGKFVIPTRLPEVID